MYMASLTIKKKKSAWKGFIVTTETIRIQYEFVQSPFSKPK